MTAPRTRTGLRLPIDLNKLLSQTAQEQGISKNALILQILWQYIERTDQKEGHFR